MNKSYFTICYHILIAVDILYIKSHMNPTRKNSHMTPNVIIRSAIILCGAGISSLSTFIEMSSLGWLKVLLLQAVFCNECLMFDGYQLCSFDWNVMAHFFKKFYIFFFIYQALYTQIYTIIVQICNCK